MTKKTVTISETITSSIIIGFLISLIIVIAGHLYQDDWKARPISSQTSGRYASIPFNTPVSSCSYKCLFGSSHVVDCAGKDLTNFDESNPNILSDSFEHISLIFFFGLVLSIIIYLFKKFTIKLA